MARPTFIGTGSLSSTSLPEYAAAFRAWAAERHKPAINVMRRTMRFVRAEAMTGFRAHGVGRAIWGNDAARGKSNLGKFIGTKVRLDKGNSVIGSLLLKGLPALQEKGGRTKGHWIGKTEAAAGKILSSGPGGIFIATAPIWHPGGVVRRDPFADAAAAKGLTKLRQELDVELQKDLQRARVA